jgi:hypothetical protein
VVVVPAVALVNEPVIGLSCIVFHLVANANDDVTEFSWKPFTPLKFAIATPLVGVAK